MGNLVIDWGSILKNAGLAAAGAVLTYVTAWATSANLGAYAPLVTAALTVLASIVHSWGTVSYNKLKMHLNG